MIEDHNCTIFYTKYLRPIDRLIELENKDKKPIKEYLMIANTHAEVDDSNVTIRFIQGNIKKGWVFKFQN